jgi:hypothetical protein
MARAGNRISNPQPGGLTPRGGRPRAVAAVLCAALLASLVLAAGASGGPTGVRIVRAPGRIVPIPDSIPHQAGAMIDRRLIGNLRYLSAHFAIFINEGYAGPLPQNPRRIIGCPSCHVADSDHKNGLAVDIGPRQWSAKCDRHWKGVTRLAHWAEPRQNRPRAPFRWVGYEGDAGHGCGNHLHLSWTHAEVARFRVAPWVEVFGGSAKPVGGGSGGTGGPSGGVKAGRAKLAPGRPPAASAPATEGRERPA